MEKYIYNEQKGLWYELHGDYYIPCLALDEEDAKPIGMLGRKHLRYIKERCSVLHTTPLRLPQEVTLVTPAGMFLNSSTIVALTTKRGNTNICIPSCLNEYSSCIMRRFAI
ncbi:MAG: TnpV protein [Oscillospiraceae bacterium]|nr:TnpV protein [Oscillospiraceae bacterium]